MPQLLSFLPCEKAIIAADGSLSVISIIESLSANLPSGVATFQANTVAPLKWSVVTIFRRTDGDGEKRFEQHTKLVLPNGQMAGDSVTEFTMTHGMVRNISTVEGFPIGITGECLLRLELKEQGASGDGAILAEFPIVISYVPAG